MTLHRELKIKILKMDNPLVPLSDPPKLLTPWQEMGGRKWGQANLFDIGLSSK